MTTIMLFGDAKAIEIAMRMIDEAVDNKEQKAKQRHKEYERKKEQKRRDRQLYHLRHARDYEELGLPMGASKLDVKKAYKCVSLLGVQSRETAVLVCCWGSGLLFGVRAATPVLSPDNRPLGGRGLGVGVGGRGSCTT